MESIYSGAFYGCTSLEEIVLPDSVKNEFALISGWGDTNDLLDDNNVKGVYENCTSLKITR